MAITFNETTRIFTLTTAHTTYQMQADAQGYLLHLYYGARTAGEMDYLLNYGDRGFSGNPNSAGSDRTYSLDALPQEYPSLGIGDFRNYALNIENADGSQCCNPVYITHEIAAGKYTLKGLPFVRAEENEAETLKIILVAGGSTAAANSGAFMGNRHSFHVSFHSMSAIKFDQIIVSVKEIQACRLGFFYCYRGFSSILNYHTSGDNIFFFHGF